MCFQLIKKEKNLTVSRTTKKNWFSSYFISALGSYFCTTSLKYSLLKYFLKQHRVKISCKTLIKLIIEEQGFILSLNNWAFAFYNKKL